jgi:hypothetical protein
MVSKIEKLENLKTTQKSYLFVISTYGRQIFNSESKKIKRMGKKY